MATDRWDKWCSDEKPPSTPPPRTISLYFSLDMKRSENDKWGGRAIAARPARHRAVTGIVSVNPSSSNILIYDITDFKGLRNCFLGKKEGKLINIEAKEPMSTNCDEFTPQVWQFSNQNIGKPNQVSLKVGFLLPEKLQRLVLFIFGVGESTVFRDVSCLQAKHPRFE